MKHDDEPRQPRDKRMESSEEKGFVLPTGPAAQEPCVCAWLGDSDGRGAATWYYCNVYAYGTECSTQKNQMIRSKIMIFLRSNRRVHSVHCLYDDRKSELASAAASTCTNASGAQH